MACADHERRLSTNQYRNGAVRWIQHGEINQPGELLEIRIDLRIDRRILASSCACLIQLREIRPDRVDLRRDVVELAVNIVRGGVESVGSLLKSRSNSRGA